MLNIYEAITNVGAEQTIRAGVVTTILHIVTVEVVCWVIAIMVHNYAPFSVTMYRVVQVLVVIVYLCGGAVLFLAVFLGLDALLAH